MWKPFNAHAPAEPIETQTADDAADSPWNISFALLTDPGVRRSANQDTGCVVSSPPTPTHDESLLAIVADGMGGHSAGEVASQLAVQTICRSYFESPEALPERLSSALAAANLAICQRAAEDESMAGMGTTCTALAISNGFAYVAHVGDSRLYRLREGEMHQMTDDHSLVMDLVRQGVITAEQARQHPERNVLNRALGRQDDMQIYTWPSAEPLRAGDRYLLCSDGLSGVLPEESIRLVAAQYEPGPACAKLIEMTRRAGAPDNITVGIVRIHDAPAGNGQLPATREMPSLNDDTPVPGKP